MESLTFFLGKPRLPVLIDTGTELIVARRWAAARLDLLTGSERILLIDANANRFLYYPEKRAIYPHLVPKRWTKAEVVALYNARKPADAPVWAPALSTRSVPKLVQEMVDLLSGRS